MSIKLSALILIMVILANPVIATKDVYTVNVTGGTRSPGTNTVQLEPYLTNETFFTLYHYMNDTARSGSSNCNGNCGKIWPPFYVENLNVNPTLNPNDFTSITRTDGMKQLAYKGWPLYLYSGDTEPYQVNGQGIKNVWFVTNVTGI
jgi:predicted lipoprotein with Yx(FWY)xxD motif